VRVREGVLVRVLVRVPGVPEVSKRFAVSGVHAMAHGTRGDVLADSDAVHGAGRLVRSS
jgi:hypothetical protein